MNPLFIIVASIGAAAVCLVNPIVGMLLLGGLWLAREMTKV